MLYHQSWLIKVENSSRACLQLSEMFLQVFTHFLKSIYLYFYFGCTGSWLHHVGSSLWHVGLLVVACGLLVAACRLLSCGLRTLSCGMHAGSSSLTTDRTWAPCIGSTESYPLDHQVSPYPFLIGSICFLNVEF